VSYIRLISLPSDAIARSTKCALSIRSTPHALIGNLTPHQI